MVTIQPASATSREQTMSGIGSSGWRDSGRLRQSRRRRSTPARKCCAFSIAFTAPPLRKCACSCSVWPARPGMVTVQYALPRQAGHTSRPDGSGTIAKSADTPCRAQASAPQPPHSSSVFVQTVTSPRSRPVRASASAATTIDAMPPFMSQEPRPTMRPSPTSGSNGSCVQPSSMRAVTTSMWPFSSSDRPPPVPANFAASCGRPAKPMPSGGVSGWFSTSAGPGSQMSTSAPLARRRSPR